MQFFFFCILYHEMGLSVERFSVDLSKWDRAICGGAYPQNFTVY